MDIFNDDEIWTDNNVCNIIPIREEWIKRFFQENKEISLEDIKILLINLLKENKEISSEDIKNELMKLLEEKRRIPIEDFEKRIKEQYNYNDIYKKFGPIVEEIYITTHHRVYFEERDSKKDKKEIDWTYINSEYYQAWKRLRRYFESFCSTSNTDISWDRNLNNAIIIKTLGFEDLFNNVYRVLLTLEEKYTTNEIDWNTYFEEVTVLLFYLFWNMSEWREINKPFDKKYADTELPNLYEYHERKNHQKFVKI